KRAEPPRARPRPRRMRPQRTKRRRMPSQRPRPRRMRPRWVKRKRAGPARPTREIRAKQALSGAIGSNNMAQLAKLVDDLSSLTVIEAAELAKMLEATRGVSAA